MTTDELKYIILDWVEDIIDAEGFEVDTETERVFFIITKKSSEEVHKFFENE